MKIGIDIDGVLTDVEQWQLDFGSKSMFEKYNKGIVACNEYYMRDVFAVRDTIANEFWEEYLFEYAINEPARKFTDEVTKRLKEDGNEIYIITARDLTDRDDEHGQKMREIVKCWLEKYNITYDKLIFSNEDKLEVCLQNNIDLMIEDKVENINEISKKIPVICFDARYNQKCKGRNIIRCYSWYDIYHKICTMK